MNLFSTFRLASSSALCAALAACATTTEPAPSTVVRTRAPQGYEKTINNYFAFKIRGPKNNVQISVDKPEPSGCPLDGYITSSRGWVVPAVYATRTGAVTGREAIYITVKQYYFWFLGDIIAGITPRIELCPGVGANFSEGPQPSAGAGALLPAAFALPIKADAPGREGRDISEHSKRGRAHERAKVASGRKHQAVAAKASTSSAKARRLAKEVGDSRANAKLEMKW